MITILITSYVILFFLTYYIMKLVRKKVYQGDDWESVFITIAMALICPVGIFIAIYGFVIFSEIKPPKWL